MDINWSLKELFNFDGQSYRDRFESDCREFEMKEDQEYISDIENCNRFRGFYNEESYDHGLFQSESTNGEGLSEESSEESYKMPEFFQTEGEDEVMLGKRNIFEEKSNNLEERKNEFSKKISDLIQRDEVKEKDWISLDRKIKGILVGWLILEKGKVKKKAYLDSIKREPDVEMVNELLSSREVKRKDTYMRTFYKSLIHHLVKKKYGYKNDKNHQIIQYSEKLTKHYFPHDEEMQKEMINTEYLSEKKLSILLKLSPDFAYEFKNYVDNQLQIDFQEDIQEYSSILVSSTHLCHESPILDLINNVVLNRTITPNTPIDLADFKKVFYKIYGKIISK